MMENALLGSGAADAELRVLAVALPADVVGEDLDVGRAVLDDRGEFEQREDVVAVDRAVGAGVPVHDEQAFGVLRQSEEGLLAAEPAAPEVTTGEPAQGGADARGYDTQHDVAYVVRHGRAY
ncbi:hypothetical protein H5I60_24585 [Streptomyces griseolus]|nr:hypothetical protein [Streptomyces griseolus]